MKKILLTAAAFALIGIVALIITPAPKNEIEPVRLPAPVTQVREQRIPQTIPAFPPPVPPQETVTTPPPAPVLDPRQKWLDALYESPSIADRLAAARQLAARNDEAGMTDLAKFVAAAEATGEETLQPIAQQVASVLGQMRGPGIVALATELAYSASPLVAQAAVDAAVASEPTNAPQQFSATVLPNPPDQRQLEEFIQRLHESEAYPQKQGK